MFRKHMSSSFWLCCRQGHLCFTNTCLVPCPCLVWRWCSGQTLDMQSRGSQNNPNLFICMSNLTMNSVNIWERRSSSAVVVKLLACGARNPGFDSRSHRYDFRDWLSPASKLRYGWNKNPQNYQPTKTIWEMSSIMSYLLVCWTSFSLQLPLSSIILLSPVNSKATFVLQLFAKQSHISGSRSLV